MGHLHFKKMKKERDLISEKDLEDDFIHEVGGDSITVFRQLKIGKYGIADIVTINKDYDCYESDKKIVVNITVYELKKRSISCKSFAQGLRYMSAIIRYIRILNIGRNSKFFFNFKVVSVGRSFDAFGSKYFLEYDFDQDSYIDFPIISFSAIKYDFKDGKFTYKDVCIKDVQLVDHGLNDRKINRYIKKLRNGIK
jgi:hypothetical protein